MVRVKRPEKSKQYKKLVKQLPDLETHIKQNKIKVVTIPANTKAPKTKGWNSKEYTLNEIQRHTGNYGILIGYGNKENGKSIAVIDIDGYTIQTDDTKEKARIKQTTKEYIYEALKDIPNSIQVKTQSGGYHIYLWTEKVEPSTSITSRSLYFPKDFKIKSLAGKCIDDSIEIFTNEGKKQCVLPSSTIYNKATNELREYQVISTLNKFSDIDTTDDINQTVINHLTSNGYTYKKTTAKKSTKRPISYADIEAGLLAEQENRNTRNFKPKNQNQDKTLKKLKKPEINEIVEIVTPVYKVMDGKKHDLTLYLGGYFSYHITKKSSNRIANGIIKEIGNIFDNSQEFKHTLLQNYDDKDKDKGGFPKLKELILQKHPDFNISKFGDQLHSICNQNFTKKTVSTLKIEEKEIPIILYENSKEKWLKYEDIFTDTDMILNLNNFNGSFNDTKTEKAITVFTFKIRNKVLELSKTTKDLVKVMLAQSKIEIPKLYWEYIVTSIFNLEDDMLKPKAKPRGLIMRECFSKRNTIDFARKELGFYLHQQGTILRRGINKPYIKNNHNGYDSVETDDILDFLNESKVFEPDSIHTEDINTALGFINERVKPSYNIVKFPNCLYDIKNFKILENPEKPILTLTEVQYNYNPEAKGKLVVEFLETSLKQQDDTPEILQDRVTAIYEFIGYLLTSGNPKFAWFIITGIGGAGKGVLTRLIISIFGTDKVGDLKLQELTPDNKFATAHLESKQINIVRDSPKKPIEDTGMLKAITGYDDIGIEPKGKDKYILPKEEVPDMVTVCNNVPKFKEGFDDSILQRAIIFEFLNRFRGTDKQNENLEDDILNNKEEMEFLIYQSIRAYKDMVENGRDFKARIDEAKTMELLGKHTDPISYILPKLVKYNSRAEEDGEDYINSNELNKLILFVSKQLGLNITGLNKNGIIKPITLLNKIRYEFNLPKEYTTSKKNWQNPYNNYNWETITVYPSLCKTPDYDDYLEKMELEEIE